MSVVAFDVGAIDGGQAQNYAEGLTTGITATAGDFFGFGLGLAIESCRLQGGSFGEWRIIRSLVIAINRYSTKEDKALNTGFFRSSDDIVCPLYVYPFILGSQTGVRVVDVKFGGQMENVATVGNNALDCGEVDNVTGKELGLGGRFPAGFLRASTFTRFPLSTKWRTSAGPTTPVPPVTHTKSPMGHLANEHIILPGHS